jgi:3alpha(or 20beta)-hydroxysteroid dehydrogenase
LRPVPGVEPGFDQEGEKMGRLDGKVAIVTGAARGTGESTARLFVEEGARVLLGDVLDDLGSEVARDLGSNGVFEHLDVTSEAQWQGAVAAAIRHFGAVDVLVNNAAVLLMAAIEDTSLEDFERVVGVNQTGTFLGIKSVAGVMKTAKAGSIVNIASIDGQTAKNGLVAYSASKWAVRGITRVAALELGKFGIRVNAVCPEAGSTAMIAPYVPEGVDLEKAVSFSQPNLATQRSRSSAEKVRDVAKLVAYLASDDSASCTGADFTIDGGNLAGSVVRGTPGS